MVEIRKSFHEQLDEIRASIVELGSMVTELIPRGTEVLLAGDLKAADELIAGDDELDALSLDIDERCTQILALQQPVASDLRAIVAAIHLVSEIERSGDLVVNIAKGTRRLHGRPIDPKLRGFISRMGEEAQRLFRSAIDAYIERDGGLAAALDDMDDTLDQLQADYVAALFESRHAQSTELQSAVQLALIGRYYERIGDHAVNVGERVAFIVTGWLPEHTGAARARIRAEVRDRAGPAEGDSGSAAPAADPPTNGSQPEGG